MSASDSSSKGETPGTAVDEARPYEPHWLLRWVYKRFFTHIQVDERWSGVVRDAARKGVVVYVMRSLSLLDFLCLDFLLKRFGLPLVRFVNDLGLWILEPFGKGDRRLALRRQIPEHDALSEVLKSQFSALLFLRRPPRLGRPKRRGEEMETDLIRTLIESQRRASHPIFLVPQTFVWTKRPPQARRGLLDGVFGTVEWPGRLRVLLQFLFNYRNALLRSGEPFDLQEFLAENPDLTDAQLADKVRYALLRRMERERTLVLGPTKKTLGRIQDDLLRSPRIRKHIESEAKGSGRSIAKVEKEARKELSKLCANQQPYVVALLARFLDWVWNRIYDGIVIDEEGIERLREKARDGAIVLLPSHKSHVDYLVLSSVLYSRQLLPPLIAAGENLGFFPLGPILRRGGAFFIKRSFRGKKLYAALVDGYMRRLLVEGFPIEFFIEGGRSRTGKLLPPKYGLLSMVVDASLLLRARKVYFVPISIGYERIIEERSYMHELGGGEKQKENVGGLLRSSDILRSKYGRLYVHFGETISFDDLLEDALAEPLADETGEFDAEAILSGSVALKPRPSGDEAPARPKRDRQDLNPRERRVMIQRLAHLVTYQIDRVTVVTPAALVAMALLTHRQRGMTHADLLQTAECLLSALERQDARTAGQLRDENGAIRSDTVHEAIELFLDGKLIQRHGDGDEAIYKIPSERRIALEYYNNNVLHFFVPSALIAAALQVSAGKTITVQTLRERVRQLSKLFKYEFHFRADAAFEDIFEDALATMVAHDELVLHGDTVSPAPGRPGAIVDIYASMLRSYFEAYILALRSTGVLLERRELSRKEWYKQALATGQRMYLAGEIVRRESISKPKLETALKALKDYQLVKTSGDDLQCGRVLTDAVTLQALEKKLLPFLK
ncbi:MAG: 1-acyl-sn-glycerol-3-phosphate acyltransferase [Sandaracinaceae bacterium]|nr:1-acyl-sn-glycerol-3-phosphate acyltransferase [Sandaracinaceae bacterium]